MADGLVSFGCFGVTLLNLQDKSDFWLKKPKNVGTAIVDVPAEKSWENSALVQDTLANICDSLENDLQALEKEALFMFSAQTETENLTRLSEDLLKKWHIAGAPSLSAPTSAGRPLFSLTNSIRSPACAATRRPASPTAWSTSC